jgi:hypothetical protein
MLYQLSYTRVLQIVARKFGRHPGSISVRKPDWGKHMSALWGKTGSGKK